MLMLNSLIVEFAIGIAEGFETTSKCDKGKIYLSGNWLINEQRYTLIVGYFWFFIVEAGLLVVGFIPLAIVMYIFGPQYWVFLLLGNLGAYLAGMLYTSTSYKVLFKWKVIREEIK